MRILVLALLVFLDDGRSALAQTPQPATSAMTEVQQTIATGWSAVFLFLVMRSTWISGLLTSRYGVVKVASLYGPLIWLVMSLAIIPLLVHRPPTIGIRWWIQLIGHIPFVGVPIVACASYGGWR